LADTDVTTESKEAIEMFCYTLAWKLSIQREQRTTFIAVVHQLVLREGVDRLLQNHHRSKKYENIILMHPAVATYSASMVERESQSYFLPFYSHNHLAM
jgi:hypothetical protein